jgi:hypoxanthine phosphoribosyltransferase
MTSHDLTTTLRRADLIHDRHALAQAIARIGADIDRTLAGQSAVFLTVMQGALIFAGQLATAIASPLTFDYVHATRYRSGTRGGEVNWIKRPTAALAGANVILVDDILDEGHTLKAIRDVCVEQGAARVLIAVLCAKRHGRAVPDLHVDFVGVDVPDRYVFGYGMDYHEQGRNLASIYAVDA